MRDQSSWAGGGLRESPGEQGGRSLPGTRLLLCWTVCCVRVCVV